MNEKEIKEINESLEKIIAFQLANYISKDFNTTLVTPDDVESMKIKIDSIFEKCFSIIFGTDNIEQNKMDLYELLFSKNLN